MYDLSFFAFQKTEPKSSDSSERVSVFESISTTSAVSMLMISYLTVIELFPKETLSQGYKTFFMLNTTEHEIYLAQKCQQLSSF